MQQEFKFVAPRARLYQAGRHTMAGMLFGPSIVYFPKCLIIPVRPKRTIASQLQIERSERRSFMAGWVKRVASDSGVNADSSQYHNQTKPRTAVTISSLPPEIHRLIFSFFGDIVDVISFGLTNRYFWSICHECIDSHNVSHVGQWAGLNIVCVGKLVQPDDYPPGLFSPEEIEALRQEKCIHRDVPFSLYDFACTCTSEMQLNQDNPVSHAWTKDFVQRGLPKDPAYEYVCSQLDFDMEAYFPSDQAWILRNLTTKQFVRSEAIALSPDYIEGPYIAYLGFGQVLVLRTCWSTSSSVDINDKTNITRGVWAGHRFDIITLSSHEAQTRAEDWSDASDEVAREIATVWEAQYGPEWRDTVCRIWSGLERLRGHSR